MNNIELNHIFLFVHLVSLIVGFGSVMVIDIFGLLWLLKKVKLSFVNQVANTTQVLIWIGWSGLVLTGIPLILIKGNISGLATVKIFAVIVLGLNGIFLHIIKKSMVGIVDDTEIPSLFKFRITLATIVSQLGWWTAIVIGFLNNKLKSNAPVINEPFPVIISIFLILISALIVGELFFRKK